MSTKATPPVKKKKRHIHSDNDQEPIETKVKKKKKRNPHEIKEVGSMTPGLLKKKIKIKNEFSTSLPSSSSSSPSLSSSTSTTMSKKRKSKSSLPLPTESTIHPTASTSLNLKKKEPSKKKHTSEKVLSKKTSSLSTLPSSNEKKGKNRKKNLKNQTSMSNLEIQKKKSKKNRQTASSPTTTHKVEVENEFEEKEEGENAEEEDDDDDTSCPWWSDINVIESLSQNTVKWTRLHHQGVVFAAPYVPHGVPLVYQNQSYVLVPEVEELATHFATTLTTPYASNPTFCKNFFIDFLKTLHRHQPDLPIQVFEHCDFSLIHAHVMEEKERKKNMLTLEEKKKVKMEKALLDDQYGWAWIDGRKEKVNNYRIEPPGLFRGRGAHPKTGTWKQRIRPEDVTLNLSEDAPIPPLPDGHHWKAIVHCPQVTWLAMWEENVQHQIKYVKLSASSVWKGVSDYQKFEKARTLHRHVEWIRTTYTQHFTDTSLKNRQLATAVYFIDRLALRVGNEKGEDVADTVGCCSLRYEHVQLTPPNWVTFDFLGKDSVRYYNQVEVDLRVYENVKLFQHGHQVGDPLFDQISSVYLNKYLQSFMIGLTAKVFRTYNASSTFEKALTQLTPPLKSSVQEKILAYNRANREVAILCNHQRAIPKSFDQKMTSLQEKLNLTKYERKRVKKQLILALSIMKKNSSADESIKVKMKKKKKKKKKNLDSNGNLLSEGDDEERGENEKEDEDEEENEKLLSSYNMVDAHGYSSGSDVDPSWLEMYEQQNEPSKLTKDELEEKSLNRSKSTLKVITQLDKKYHALTQRIAQIRLDIIEKKENKTTALGTSKLNYIDPRITVAWCHQHQVPIEKMFTKTLLEKFKWAMGVNSKWQF
ncbi:DNA topoisomerase 1 [Coelomomyces lativittatus]|nr:DNA topoisomerase 1 [Coelomomyces lativittatus]